jgi:VWFA-related protein
MSSDANSGSAAGKTGAAGAPAAASAPFSDGRVFVIGVDQQSFPLAAQASVREAVRRVIESVKPEDYVGLVAFPGKTIIAPTRDRQLIRQASEQIQGLRYDIRTRLNISATEAGLLKSGDAATSRAVISRECPLNSGPQCATQVRMDADQIIMELQRQAATSISGLHSVIDGTTTLPGRKTLLVLSAGLPMSNRTGVEPNINLETTRLASHAASANVNLYVFFLNIHFLRAFSAEMGKINNTLFQDMDVFGYGLEKFAASANGAFFEVRVDSDPFVARVMRETSAYYLLSVAPEPRDRDGKEHFIQVKVKQGGTAVRYRTVLVIPPAG